jgi:hypothetical protein
MKPSSVDNRFGNIIDSSNLNQHQLQQQHLQDSNAIVDFSVGSMPANYGYDESFGKDDDSIESQFKPRILIMGLRRLKKLEIILNFVY